MRFEHGHLLIVLLFCCSSAATLLPVPFRTFRQCLHLDEDVGPWEACGPPGRHVRLRFCDAYSPDQLLTRCDAPALDALRRQDMRARQAACRFRQLLDRYDCENTNSVSWACQDCLKAYKQWVCAMYLPQVQMESEGVKPCRYICRLVEQKCPYFHPSVKDQYAGERVFKCIDPDIPDLESIQAVSAYGPAHRCYCPQHLGGESSNESECRFLTPAQLRRDADIRHNRGAAVGGPHLLLLLLMLAAYRWTRTTR